MLNLTDPSPGINPRKQEESGHTSGIIQGCDVHVLIAVIELERFPSQNPAGNGDTSLDAQCKGSRPPLPTPQPQQPLAASRDSPSARRTSGLSAAAHPVRSQQDAEALGFSRLQRTRKVLQTQWLIYRLAPLGSRFLP